MNEKSSIELEQADLHAQTEGAETFLSLLTYQQFTDLATTRTRGARLTSPNDSQPFPLSFSGNSMHFETFRVDFPCSINEFQ